MSITRSASDVTTVDTLLDKVRVYLPPDKVEGVARAYEYAAQAHDGQLRKSGEPYVQHPLEAAMILADIRLDSDTVIAGLLHDVPEDCGVPLREIEKRFGGDVAKLVDGTTKIAKIAHHARSGHQSPNVTPSLAQAQAENLRKMLLAMAEDVRVVLVKLADRLHNMRTLEALPPSKRRTIARETLEIYAPLASRLGIWELKWQLEDLAFKHLEPERYEEIVRLVRESRAVREQYIAEAIELLREELERAGIRAEVAGRPKHIYSVYKKMEKYAQQGKDFNQIYDLLAVRVLVDDVHDCYSALGIVHGLWRPIPGQFDDYIAMPKESMYRSLHTTVVGPGGKPLEIQIRSHEMHRVSEYGIAAHWRYKEGKAGEEEIKLTERMAWLRQLIEWQKDVSGAIEFVESVKTDIFQDRVFAYSPKGDIKDLPAGSTPIDFAYRIHTDLGHRCVGAKVNGRLVPLDYQLKNGDFVEILSAKNARGPSRDWLNPELGYVKTSHAREKIRQWFKRQERAENIERGREAVEKELKRLGVTISLEELAKLFRHERPEDFYLAVSYGDVSTQQVAAKLAAEEQQQTPVVTTPARTSSITAAVSVMGAGGLLTQLARCCNPVPGDDIIGYITRSRGVSVHRMTCPNVLREDETERLVPVQWGKLQEDQSYPVSLRLEAWDRVGLLRDITTVVSEERINLNELSTSTVEQLATVRMTLQTTGLGQLSRLLAKLESVRGVLSARRDVPITTG